MNSGTFATINTKKVIVKRWKVEKGKCEKGKKWGCGHENGSVPFGPEPKYHIALSDYLFVFAGLLAAAAFAGAALAAGLLAGAVLVVVEFVTVVELPLAATLVVLVVFVVEVAFELAVLAAFAVLAGLLAELFAGAASPQAIPSALRPRTVESTITFFIRSRSPVFFKVKFA